MAHVDFSYLSAQLVADSELRERIREAVKEVEQATRTSTAVLGRVHSSSKEQSAFSSLFFPSFDPFELTHPPTVPQLLASVDPTLPDLRSALANLAKLIPKEQFYRYSDSFSRAMQTSSYIVVLRVFLEKEDVASKSEVAEALGRTCLSFPFSLISCSSTEAPPVQSRRNGVITSSSRRRSTSTLSSPSSTSS
jgi:hypothetical protein